MGCSAVRFSKGREGVGIRWDGGVFFMENVGGEKRREGGWEDGGKERMEREREFFCDGMG